MSISLLLECGMPIINNIVVKTLAYAITIDVYVIINA